MESEAMKKISPLTFLSFLLLVNAFPLHAQGAKPGMPPPAAVIGSEVRTGFVASEIGFFYWEAYLGVSRSGGKCMLLERKGDLKA
jgi:hypothetical protein